MDDNKKDSIGEEVSAFGQRAKGDVKEATGTVTGDSSLRAEGATESATGAARQKSNRMVTGLFRDRDSAERAYGSLSTRGYSKDDVNLLMSDETRKTHFSSDDAADTDLGSKALEGAGAGAAIGGTTGAVLAAIAAIGTSVILPGLGLVVAGPLAAALAGAGAGGATGGLIGALIGSGIPEDRAAAYESGVKEGGIVMGVNARSDEDAEYFENEFKTHRGENVYR
ncbi:MAG: hypothetical protein QOG00_1686 [Pyrinomonadaceae bacterium]|nr:hypothetical protein [Pyrinomonadaceae bacterium]